MRARKETTPQGKQSGMGAILGVCVLSISLWMGLALMSLGKIESDIAADFLAGLQAQHYAETGARQAIRRLKEAERQQKAPGFNALREGFVSRGAEDTEDTLEGEHYKAYIGGSLNERTILSVGEAGRVKRQVVVRVRIGGEHAPLSVIQWNNE